MASGTFFVMSDATRTSTLEITRTRDELVLSAPHLLPLVRLWFRVRADPADRSSYIQLRLLSQRGVDRCPTCEQALSLEGYRKTRTGFAEREVLACSGCRTTYVLHERHVV